MLAGRLRERITILERSATQDALGQDIITWTPVETLWAEAIYSTLKGDGNELANAGQVQDMNTIRFRVRYNSGVTQLHRLEFNGAGYDIQAVTHETHKYTIIRAMEGIKDGR